MTSREQAMEVIAAIIGNHAFFGIDGDVVYIEDEIAQHIAIDALTALLAARVPCPTCSGTGEYADADATAMGPHPAVFPCPDCDDGRGGPLVLLGPIEVGEVIGDPVTGFRQRALGGPITNARIAYVARPENEEA